MSVKMVLLIIAACWLLGSITMFFWALLTQGKDLSGNQFMIKLLPSPWKAGIKWRKKEDKNAV